ERLPEVAALVAAERDHQAGGGDAHSRAERPDVDERAAQDHQPADRDEGDRQHIRRRAEQRVEAVGERAAHVAAVPARVLDAAEEEAERDEAEAPELGMVQRALARGLRPALLDAGRGLRTQLSLPLRTSHRRPYFATEHRRPARL